MKLTALECHSWGPAGYRVRLPFEALKRRGHETRIISAGSGPGAFCLEWFTGCDVLLIQRQADLTLLEMLDQIPAPQRPAVVYEIDDLLWALHGGNRDQRGIRAMGEDRAIMRYLRRADAVTVTTPELAEHARKFNSNVYAIPNAIDYGIREWGRRLPSRPAEYSVVIGWAGSLRGTADFRPMGNALRDVLRAHPEACFAMGGAQEENAKHCAALGLPEAQVFLLPPCLFHDYPQLISIFDVGIAPLATTTSNACKSELKLTEYGAWGIPYVASDIAPYRRFRTKTGGVGGCLCRTENEWRKALEQMVSEPALREFVAQPLRDAVRKAYSLDVIADQWEYAFQLVAQRQRDRRGNSQAQLGRQEVAV